MSATTGGRYTAAQPGDAAATADYDEGLNGWVMFAGTMLAIVSILNVVYGIAAIGNANFYVGNAQYVFSDLNTWGWVMVVLGAIQFTGACALFVGSAYGRWIGIASAGGNAIAQLLWIPAYPLLSIALFTIDVLVLYGLIAHGGRRQMA
jgi:putative flippase GtrA